MHKEQYEFSVHKMLISNSKWCQHKIWMKKHHTTGHFQGLYLKDQDLSAKDNDEDFTSVPNDKDKD